MRRILPLVCVSSVSYTDALTNAEILAQNAKTREAALSKHPTERPDYNIYAKKQATNRGHCAECAGAPVWEWCTSRHEGV